MPKPEEIKNPDEMSDDELVSFVVTSGSYTAAASELGWNRDKMTRYLGSRGLKGRTDEEFHARGGSARVKVRADSPVDEPEAEKSAPPALDDEVTKIEQLTLRNRELEAQIKRERKGKVYEERVLARIEDAIPDREPLYRPLDLPEDASSTPHEMVLLFSDLHAGEVVDEEETMGLNRYDWRTMLDRMARLQKSVLSFQKHRPYPISKLTIAMLGDMLSGDIHDELSITNEMPLEESVVQLGYDTAAWIEEFVPHFEKIHVVGVPGNHPRRTKKPAAKQAYNNADWTMYQFAKLAVTGPDESSRPYITWDFPRSSYALTTVAERWRMLLMHGDGIRTTMPGVPWGGVVRRITTLEQQFAAAKQPIDYFALGHFHTRNALEGVSTQTFINGSLKGVDEYSLKSFGSGRPPGQLLLTFHPNNGWTDLSNIDLESVSPNGELEASEVSR